MVQTNKGKNIYRYLPPNIGRLLLYYLWMILPFWHAVKGCERKAVSTSAYLFTTKFVFAEGEEEKENTSLWNSEKLTKILREMALTTMGVPLDVSTWRHIAIAIARKFLQDLFSDEHGNDESDNVWDLQAAHRTDTASRVYAILNTQSQETTQRSIDGYRRISIIWHDFWFPSRDDPSVLVEPNTEYGKMSFSDRVQRLTDLATVNIWNRMRIMMPFLHNVQFRGNQEVVLKAVIGGVRNIVQIAATGTGKSLSFMLPAFCAPHGVTLVVVPTVSLQNDLAIRARNLKLHVATWNEMGRNSIPAILLITPESVMSATFLHYMNNLINGHRLDRIVIDECHTLLTSDKDFRPKIHDLKAIVHHACVQLLLLTATLPPILESDLCSVLNIPNRETTFFREPTTRKNIKYRVLHVSGGLRNMLDVIRSELRKPMRGKAIIYCQLVKDGKYLSEELNCLFYHSTIGSSGEKEEIINNFMQDAHVIVATNALGLGVDIPGVEMVIHAGSPRQIIDFAQESGRCGRDGRSSESVLLFSSTHVLDSDMKSFVRTKGCRRIVLDRAMDGAVRLCCSNDEVCCDNCYDGKPPARRMEDESFGFDAVQNDTNSIFDDDGISDEALNALCDKASSPPDIPANAFPNRNKRNLVEDSIKAQCMNETVSRRRITDDRQKEANILQRCQDMLHEFVGCKCIICKLQGSVQNHIDHGRLCQKVRQRRTAAIDRFMSTDKFPKFSGCFEHGCYAPQAWCNGWEENRLRRERGEKKVSCIYRYICLDVIYTILLLKPELSKLLSGLIKETQAKDEVHLLSLGKTWYGVQTNYLYYAFYVLLNEYNRL